MKALTLILLATAGLYATPVFTIVPQPNSSYTSNTTLLPFTDPLESMIMSVSDGTLTISFLFGGSPTIMDVNLVPTDWATWGSPPETETSTPTVVRPDDTTQTDIVFSFSVPLTTFGVELEPDDTTNTLHPFTTTYSLGGNTAGVIQESVSGNAAARLFAASGGPFDQVEVISNVDFAAAQFRYVAVPEPATSILLLAPLVIIVVRTRRERPWRGTHYRLFEIAHGPPLDTGQNEFLVVRGTAFNGLSHPVAVRVVCVSETCLGPAHALAGRSI